MEDCNEALHCVKSVRIRKFSGRYFPAFRLNTERYSVYTPISLRIQSECGKIRTRKTPNTESFHAVLEISLEKFKNYIRSFRRGSDSVEDETKEEQKFDLSEQKFMISL